jgi:hypothetical protein
MASGREKRNNTGKAPQRPGDAIESIPVPPTPSGALRRATSKARGDGIVLGTSQASAGSRNRTPAPASTSIRKSIRPASLRRQEDVSTAPPTLQTVYDDSEDSQAVGEGSESQEEDAGADVIEIQSTG